MSAQAKFTTGSTMRHVAVMTATGAVGLLSIFLVDAANLFYISLLGVTELAAAIGFAGTVQFFMISVAIGLSIAATAVVSRAVGSGGMADARRLAASSTAILVAVLALVAALVWYWREQALILLGAEDETLAVASRFLAIVLPALPFMGIGMVSSGLLRAVGDAKRAMYVTLSGGLIAAVLDPIFIFGFGLGVDGAAIVTVIVRIIFAGVGLWGVVRVHDMLGPLDPRGLLADGRVLLAIALPAVATQLSTPFGNAYLTSIVADYGDDAVAGWAVVGRLSALAFGGIFALSGAVGPIFGQNLGAGLHDRIRRTYRDALLFAVLYVLIVWAILWLAADAIIMGFGLIGDGAEVLRTFATYGAGAFLFTSALFVSNSCFNNLGRPTWSTMCNWTRDAVVIPLLALIVAGSAGAAGAVVIQALAGLTVGTLAAVLAWRYVRRIEREAATSQPPDLSGPAFPPFASGRAAISQCFPAGNRDAPLASGAKTD